MHIWYPRRRVRIYLYIYIYIYITEHVALHPYRPCVFLYYSLGGFPCWVGHGALVRSYQLSRARGIDGGLEHPLACSASASRSELVVCGTRSFGCVHVEAG